ncbi:MAG: hypothetical protein H7289_16340 [Mucilaginibacter sp.]|nr:hypothetical protein [Mucilaginibacter sp.]
MIRVSCSKLEVVRLNPSIFAQQLAAKTKNRNGSYGMFACWQAIVKSLHANQIDFSQAKIGLQQKFITFKNSPVNRKKQEFLLDRLTPYWELFQSKNLTYLGPQKDIYWNVTPEVALTGRPPHLASDGGKYIAYFYSEAPVSWHTQLKYPLIQYYLAKDVFKCDPEQIQIGTYCLKTLSFDLITYSLNEIENSILETQNMFNNIYQEYSSYPKSND